MIERRPRFSVVVLALAVLCAPACGQEQSAEELQRFKASEAVQAVAVDASHFYAIGNSVIAKYKKESGENVARWSASKDIPLRHLNAGIVREGLIYCANSNFPAFPETSSVEVFNTKTLAHVSSHSFGIYEGSLTWVDWHDEAWWGVFAHYSKKVNDNPRAKPHAHTSLVKFDDQWRRLGGWVFPQEVLDRFSPHSCSGGGWGPDGLLYCTGHDRGEIYCLRLPRGGSELVLVQTILLDITGQGFAWDKSNPGVIYGIDRAAREVVVSRMELSSK